MHAKPQLNEHYHVISGWIKALACALNEKLGQNTSELFEEPEEISELDNNRLNHEVAIKLDALYKLLNMSPYDNQGNHQATYKESKKEIEPACVICPSSMECQTESCNGRNLHLITKDHDVPRVTLIKESKLYEKVHLLTGECQLCYTKYFPDHICSKCSGSKC